MAFMLSPSAYPCVVDPANVEYVKVFMSIICIQCTSRFATSAIEPSGLIATSCGLPGIFSELRVCPLEASNRSTPEPILRIQLPCEILEYTRSIVTSNLDPSGVTAIPFAYNAISCLEHSLLLKSLTVVTMPVSILISLMDESRCTTNTLCPTTEMPRGVLNCATSSVPSMVPLPITLPVRLYACPLAVSTKRIW